MRKEDKMGFDQLRKQLAAELGLSTVADVPYDLCHRAGKTVVRLPGPSGFLLDGKPAEVTGDILGYGEDEETAFDDAFDKYLGAAAALEKAKRSNGKSDAVSVYDPRTQHVLH